MNAHLLAIARAEQRDAQRMNTLRNLAADLAAARSHTERLTVLQRHSATLQQLEPRFTSAPPATEPRVVYTYTSRRS